MIVLLFNLNKMGVFDLNDKSDIYVENFMGSNIYYIDDFYKEPDTIVKILNTVPATFHTPHIDAGFESFNGVHFEDMRHEIPNEEMKRVSSYLSRICGRNHGEDHGVLMTNKTRFFPTRFNDYKNNFGYPHMDNGYTALIYFNKNDSECGTNLYRNIIPDTEKDIGEHVVPWRPKTKWEIIKTLKPKFNRCVLFDGGFFLHGMHIPNDTYFKDEYRLNQVIFFQSAVNLKI